MSVPRPDYAALSLLGVAAALLCSSLGNGLLWQDEAETALLARHTLRFGYPRANDGRSPMEIQQPYKHGPGEAWIYSPWAPFYLLAGVFAVFGESTAIARAPFAILGWLSIWLAWRMAKACGFSVLAQRLTVAGLAFSVPFLLHMRQCRYYGMVTAVFTGVCWLYLKWSKKPGWGSSLALGSLIGLLFHTNFGTFVPTVGALAVDQGFNGTKTSRSYFLLVGLAAAALCIPWVLAYFQPGSFIGKLTLGRALKHLGYYVRIINKFLLPVAAIALVEGVRFLAQRSHYPAVRLSRAGRFFILMSAAQVVFLLLPDQRQMRYLMPIVPVFAIAQAAWLARCFNWNRFAGTLLSALLLATALPATGRLRVPTLDLLYELTHAYRGPMDGVVEYLNRHGKAGETIKISYDDRTLNFYTKLKIEPPSQFAQETYPRWIVLRRDWLPAGFLDSAYYRRISAKYERIELDAPDVLWQNREDPGSHHFRTAAHAPPVVIYRLGQ